MKEERQKILKMVEEKKITAEEAAQLLEALDEVESAGSDKPGKTARNLVVRIYADDATEPKVNLNVPVSWVKGLAGFMMPKIEEKLKAEGCSFDRDEFMAMINNSRPGKLIDVQNGKNKVEIFIE